MASILILVGVGHVFDIKNKIKSIIEEELPQAIALELDMDRMRALLTKEKGKAPLFYSILSKMQEKLAKKFGTKAGGEMLAAIETAREKNIPIILIDMNAREIVDKLWKNLSFKNKIKLLLSSFFALFMKKDEIEREIKKFEKNADEIIKKMEKEYPEIKKILVDERNKYMAEQLRKCMENYEKVVAFVGEGHVEGLKELLKDLKLKIVHLSKLMH